MAQSTIDPTFYRTAAEAAAAPVEQLAYVVAFDRAAKKNDAMTVVDVNPGFRQLRTGGRLDRRPGTRERAAPLWLECLQQRAQA